MEKEEKITILYLIGAKYFGGAEHYIAMLSTSLNRELFEPVVSFSEDAHLRVLEERLLEGRVRVRKLPRFAPFPVWHLFRDERPSVVHMNLPSSYDCGFGYPALVAKLSGCRAVVATEHLPMIETRRLGLLKRMTAVFTDAFITVSHANVDFLRESHRIPDRKIHVVHNGVPLGHEERRQEVGNTTGLRSEPGEFLIGFVGSLTERKGHRTAFEALKTLRSGGMTPKLILVGEGELENELKAHARADGLETCVTFLGQRDDVRLLMRQFDVLILPSQMEGLPLVILEAMAEGVPVVASRVYGVPEAVLDGETGYLVSSGDSQGFARAIGTLIRDPDLRRRMGEQGKRRAEERFSSENMVRETERLYLRLLHGGDA